MAAARHDADLSVMSADASLDSARLAELSLKAPPTRWGDALETTPVPLPAPAERSIEAPGGGAPDGAATTADADGAQ